MPLPVILSIVSSVQTALGVIGAFSGSPAAAKINTAVQDAAKVVAAFTPLVQQYVNGEDVTLEQAQAALAGAHVSQDGFEALIKAKTGAQP